MQDRGAPAYFVSVRRTDGDQISIDDLSHLVLGMQYEDNERGADKLQIEVDNFDLGNFDNPVWATGNVIEFSYGYESGLAPVREAVIRKVTGSTKLKIEAHGMAVIMDRIKQNVDYENVTRSDVVREIAFANGFGVDTQDIEDTFEVFEVITQPNMTDAQMLRKLAYLEGFEFYVEQGVIHWHRRRVGQAPIRTLTYYTDPGAGDITHFDIENDLTRRPGKVTVKSRDPETKTSISEVADNLTDAEREVLRPLIAQETIGVVDLETGGVTRKKLTLVSQLAANEHEIPSNASTSAEAKTEAKKLFRKASQTAVKMKISMVGDPHILAKSVIEVAGMGKRLSGKYYVKKATHALRPGSGYMLSLELITDGFQGSGGSKKTDAQLQSYSTAVIQLIAAMYLVDSVVAKEMVNRLSKLGEPRTVADAQRITNMANTIAKFLTEHPNARQAAIAVAQAASVVGVALQGDKEAKGKLNTKDVVDGSGLTPEEVPDGEGGTMIQYTPGKGQ